MYKRHDQNSFPVVAEEILRRKGGRTGGRERMGGREERDREKKNYYGGGKDYAIVLHSPARRQMGENGARAKGCREIG